MANLPFLGGFDFLPGVNVGAAFGSMLGGNQVANKNIDIVSGVSPTDLLRGDALDNYYVNQSIATSPRVKGAATTATRDQSTNTTSGAYGGVSGGYSAPSYDPNTLAQFDQSENIINNSLGRLDGQLGIARGNVTGQYDNQLRDMNTQRDNSQKSYDTSTVQNSQQLRGNKNTISDQASQGLRGLMRMLGSYGALGSSDASVAGRAVADQASQQRAGAGQNFAANQSDLDTNWGNYVSGFESNKNGLENWKQNNLNQVESQSLSTRQDLLSKLADIKGQRAALIGGSYTGSAQPYLDQANALSGRIDGLGRSVQAYAGTAPTYQAKELSSYDAGSGTAGLVANPQGMDGGLNTPYLSLLLGRDKQKQSLLR